MPAAVDGGGKPHNTSYMSTEAEIRRLEERLRQAVVTCKGTYEGPKGAATLKFMRVWLKRGAGR
jgi:hypothetical protein